MSTGVVAQGGRWRSRHFGEVGRGGRAQGPPLRCECEGMSTGVVAQGGRWRSRRFGEVGRGGRAQGPPLRCEGEGHGAPTGKTKSPAGAGLQGSLL